MNFEEVSLRAIAYAIVCSILLFIILSIMVWMFLLVQLVTWIFILPINEVLIG